MADERKFLHDLSSPMAAIQLNVESVLMLLEERNPEDLETCIKFLKSTATQVSRVSEMISVRREELKKQTSGT